MRSHIEAVDLFCGGGGTSTGLALACKEMGRTVDLLACNHWKVAVDTHKANHPWARHLCETLDSVDPRKVIEGGRLNVLAASPECTHHSVARGGKPINDQSRATAWHVLRWCEALRVDTVLVENVPEFKTWGPIGTNGRPLKSRRGETFNAWRNALISLGYDVQDRVLNAADFGDATTRKRLFVLASRRRGGVKWPDPSHAKDPGGDLWKRAKWRAAREIIDWSLAGKSIFDRKRPLSPKTLARIAHGLRKFGGKAAEPFLLLLRGTSPEHVAKSARSVEDPLSALTGGGVHHAVVQPFVLCNRNNNVPTHIDEPIKPLCAGGQHMALIEPFVTALAHGGHDCRSRSIEEPIGTQHGGGNKFALVEPMLLPQGGGGAARPVSDPAPTIACAGAVQVVEPFLVPRHGEAEGQELRTHDVRQPMPTIPAAGGPALVEPLLVPYYGASRGCSPVSSPMPTATAKQRFALVTIEGQEYALDIRLRMLQPHELAAAMGFPADYRFVGTKTDAVRMIGNAVAVNQAKALFRSLIA